MRPPVRHRAVKYASACAALIVGLLIASSARAVEIVGVQPFAFDQPQIYALLQPAAGGAPYSADIGFGFQTFNISGFLDTGSSGVESRLSIFNGSRYEPMSLEARKVMYEPAGFTSLLPR